MLLDRLIGWATVAMTIIIIPLGLILAEKPTTSVLERYGLLVFTILGALGITRSSVQGFFMAIVAFGIRGAMDSVLLGMHPKDRFISSAWFFDVLIIGYAYFRIRALTRKRD